MMAPVVEILSWLLILLGSFFMITGGIGFLRMPDVYTRMHAGSLVDTVGAGFLILGMMLQAGLSLVTLKLLFVFALFFFIGPVVTHALAQAALHEKVAPLLLSGRRRGISGKTSRSRTQRRQR